MLPRRKLLVFFFFLMECKGKVSYSIFTCFFTVGGKKVACILGELSGKNKKRNNFAERHHFALILEHHGDIKRKYDWQISIRKHYNFLPTRLKEGQILNDGHLTNSLREKQQGPEKEKKESEI